ncbi:unnamed protein product, partial [Meganyctiphanes norvegica]
MLLDFRPVSIEPTGERFLLATGSVRVQARVDLTKLFLQFEEEIARFNDIMKNITINIPHNLLIATCYMNPFFQREIEQIEDKASQLLDITLPSTLRDTLLKTPVNHLNRNMKYKRSLVPVLGTILHQLFGTGTEETEKILNYNIHKLESQVHSLDEELESVLKTFNYSLSIQTTIEEDHSWLMNLNQTLHILPIIKQKCKNITNIMGRQLSKYHRVIYKLVRLKKAIPYGDITSTIAPDKIYKLLHDLSDKLQDGYKFTSENINDLPVFEINISGGLLTYSFDIPVTQFSEFHILRVQPIPFVSPLHTCNRSICTFSAVDLPSSSMVGISDDEKFFSYLPTKCRHSTKIP